MSEPRTSQFIILPGVNSGAYLFAAAEKALGKNCRILVLDPPGVGRPPMLQMSFPFSTKAYAREVLRYMDLHNIWQASILGHSMGGFAAQELAHLAPHRVEKLILVSTSCGQPATTRDVALMAVKLKKSFWQINQDIEREPHRTLKTMFGPRFVTQHPHAYDAFVKMRGENLPGPSVSLAHLSAGGGFSSLRWLRKVDTPTLVIHGSDDVLVSAASAREMAGMLPQAQYIELHGVGHFPMLEHPKFWAYVKDFLAERGKGLKVPPKPASGLWSRIKEFMTRHG